MRNLLIKHNGDFQELTKMAYERNVVITSISKKTYEDMERKLKFAEDLASGKTIEELIGAPEYH